jgi:RNA polymerase-binding transcription factor DksA
MNTEHFKQKLIEEKKRLETELGRISAHEEGKEVPAETWEATKTLEIDPADDTELADSFEELSTNQGIVSNLEKQLKDVDAALEKIGAGNFGICEIGGELIEEDRLEANPAARTCKAHMNTPSA